MLPIKTDLEGGFDILKANSAICDSVKKDMEKKGHSVFANKIFRMKVDDHLSPSRFVGLGRNGTEVFWKVFLAILILFASSPMPNPAQLNFVKCMP